MDLRISRVYYRSLIGIVGSSFGALYLARGIVFRDVPRFDYGEVSNLIVNLSFDVCGAALLFGPLVIDLYNNVRHRK